MDSSALSSDLLKLVKSHDVFIIEGIEIGSLAFVRELRCIADHISMGMEPSVVVVSLHKSGLVIDLMNEDSILPSVVFVLFQSLNKLSRVIESSIYNKSLISVLSSIAEFNLVFSWVKLVNIKTDIHSCGGFDLSRHGCGFQLEVSNLAIRDWEVMFRNDESGFVSDNGHFEM